MARDEFQGQEGGGGITDFTFTVTDAYFASDPKYAEAGGGDVVFLHLLGTSDVEGRETMGADDFHPSFSLAEHWTTVDGGKTVTSSKSGNPRLGKYYGKFCTRVIDLTEHVANTDQDPLAGANTPRSAATWIGTKWFFENETFDYGNIGKFDHLMPTQFLGIERAGAAPAAAPQAAPAAAQAPAAPPAGGESLRDKVIALAHSAPTYQVFQKTALAVDGVINDSQLLEDIANETSGIWAQVQS